MSAEKRVPFKVPVEVRSYKEAYAVWERVEGDDDFMLSAPCLIEEEAEFIAAAINEKAAREKEG